LPANKLLDETVKAISMTTKERTAGISILANVVLTILKFVAFSFTGSMAVLAEAWHSFSDITTSILVFISVREKPLPLLGKDQKENKKLIRLEYVISLSIGVLLFFVSVALIFKAIKRPPSIIENPVIVGIFFIIFAISSYIVYHFETSVGKKENSVGLIADGMHSKADMINSLLIGFSLIIYKMGFNIDILVAFIIALFILSFSVEIIVNSIMAYEKREEKYTFNYKSITIASLLFNEKAGDRLVRYLKGKFVSKIPLSSVLWKVIHCFTKAVKYVISLLLLLLVLLYLSTCFYKIGPSQEGILERFGKSVSYGHAVQPGIHLKFPWPIDRIVKINSKTITARNIGNISDKNSFALLWTKDHGTETPFISGDNNFFYPYLVIHYRIKDVFKYKYGHIDSDMLVDNIALRVISNIFAKKDFYQIVTTYRKQFEQDITKIIQKRLDMMDSGIEIININMKDIHPPIFISSSFEEVVAAYQQKEQLINESLGRRNKSIPNARGRSEKIIREAESYVIGETKKSTGEASRFLMQLEGYQKSPEIIRKKIYYDFIKNSFSENQKIIVDPYSGFPDVFLNLDKLARSYNY
jgi:modulator of FtsH protease HflK